MNEPPRGPAASGRGGALLRWLASPVGASVALAALVAVTWLPSIGNSFVGGDDDIFLDAPRLDRQLSDLPSIFTAPMGGGAASGYYRPVLTLVTVLTHAITGGSALGYRVLNLLQHLASALLLYRCGRLLFREQGPTALLAAALFAVHPANNEPVGRATATEGLYGLFVVATLFLFLKGARRGSLVTLSLALLTKETAIVFPIALGVLAVAQQGLRRGLRAVLPHFAVLALFLGLRLTVVGSGLGAVGPLGGGRLPTMLAATLDYARLLVVPFPLQPFYPAIAPPSSLEPRVLLAVAALAAAATLLYRARSQRELPFLAASMLLTLAPAIYKANDFVWGPDRVYLSERYLYVPSMFFCLLVAALVAALAHRAAAGPWQRAVAVGSAGLVATFAILSLSAAGAWRDEETLHRRIVSQSPGAVFAHNNLGVALLKQRRLPEAADAFRTALQLAPNHAMAHYNLGLVAMTEGRHFDAIAAFRWALSIDPAYVDAHVNLGNAYLNAGVVDDAIRSYEAALRLDATRALAHANLANAYERKGLHAEALRERALAGQGR